MRPDIVVPMTTKVGLRPLMSPERVQTCWRRVTDRLANIHSCETTIAISEDCAMTFFKMHADSSEGVNMTGEKTKLLVVSLPFEFENVFTPQVY